ncbi:monovalent cation/H+ antiporter subunit D [Aestuariirhabdus litorea]|uniref:Monovalent cation/H+ antiporter subunit D n=1 Tax=Aestuariirhabdus litorea TaxID=2528527 RepID=A0A3P3VUW1_9GAMM|nr:monovalent cation/H+ antiporter subunit D [Aestuariirhabdus litorea]RRJ85406.1 monovalent cation/H+ antiporter subunit D [Aestuariirhabdus litorea]RWW98628.1 monovalent cation/H+ antiporter subunit D [Endozoicomonadaceae bacterium GTF-13]
MQHLAILPILVPMLVGILQLLPPLQSNIFRQRVSSLLAVLALLAVATLLLVTSTSATQVYSLGGWTPPFGIVLVADRLSSMMVLLTTVLGFGALLYACAGEDNTGMYFHPLFLFQLTGINGAFLTGDIFNLFVFFEILLIASYALLIHGGGKQKTQASVHYVTLNLVGSAMFLFALGILYGTLGTLNMADMAQRVTLLHPQEAVLAQTGALLLLLVFGLKSAMLPLHFWLPRTYASASAPVAALFAIMTKVGVYSIYRVHGVIFGEGAGLLADVALPWLWPLAILTLIIGTIGVLASPTLRTLTANLVLVSVGTLLLTLVVGGAGLGAGLYYMLHTTLVTGALFLLADLIGKQRGKAEDRFVPSRPITQGGVLGALFFIAAMAVVGLPPLSGFVGKVLILQASNGSAGMLWVWSLILLSGLAALVAVSRAGTTLFWKVSGDPGDSPLATRLQLAAVVWLLLASPLLVIFGGPAAEFTEAAAAQMQLAYPTVKEMMNAVNQP